MRTEVEGRTSYKDDIIRSLRRWLRRLFAVVAGRRHNKNEYNELHRLSEHLLDDLGFARNGQPLHWSSFSSEQSESDCYRLFGEERKACLQNLTKLQRSCCH